MEGRVRASDGEPALRAWVERLLGGNVVSWERLVAGNSRTTWSADVVRAGEQVPLVVRVDPGDGPFSDTPLTLAREAAIYAEMQGRGVALPRTYGFDEGLGALALERAPGAPAWDEQVLGALLEELSRLHTIDASLLTGDWVARSARSDLELWAGIAERRVSPRSPFVDFAVRRLRERFPGEPGRLVVVHGDAGPGNLLWDGTRITALLDWELAHVGDPHDDLAFLSVRAALYGIDLEDFGRRLRDHYLPPVEMTLDEQRLRYWQAVGLLKNLVTCLISIANPVRGRDRLVHHMLVPPLNALLVRALARVEEIELEAPAALAPAEPLPGADVLAEIAEGLTEVVGALEQEEPRQRARRMRYLLAQLAETISIAPEVARLEASELPADEEDTASTLQRLARSAERRLELFPRAAALARTPLAGLN
jgi:aminoglycoside phosphotransferase (APT) family kinase protein